MESRDAHNIFLRADVRTLHQTCIRCGVARESFAIEFFIVVGVEVYVFADERPVIFPPSLSFSVGSSIIHGIFTVIEARPSAGKEAERVESACLLTINHTQIANEKERKKGGLRNPMIFPYTVPCPLISLSCDSVVIARYEISF